MPQKSEKNEDPDRYAQQPQQDRPAHIFLLGVSAQARALER